MDGCLSETGVHLYSTWEVQRQDKWVGCSLVVWYCKQEGKFAIWGVPVKQVFTCTPHGRYRGVGHEERNMVLGWGGGNCIKYTGAEEEKAVS